MILSKKVIQENLISYVHQFAVDHLKFDADKMHLGPYKFLDISGLILFYILDSNRHPLYLIKAVTNAENQLEAFSKLLMISKEFENLTLKKLTVLFPFVMDSADTTNFGKCLFQAYQWPAGSAALKLFNSVQDAKENPEERVKAMNNLEAAMEKIGAALAEFNSCMVKKGPETKIVIIKENYIRHTCSPFLKYSLNAKHNAKLFNYLDKWAEGSHNRAEWPLGVVLPTSELFNVMISKKLNHVILFNFDEYRNLEDPTKLPKEPIAYNFAWMQEDVRLESCQHYFNDKETERIVNAFTKSYQKNISPRLIPPEACKFYACNYWMYYLFKLEKKFHQSRTDREYNLHNLEYARKRFFSILDQL